MVMMIVMALVFVACIAAMADAVKMFRGGAAHVWQEYFDDGGHTFKMALMDTGYTYDADSHLDMADVNSDELNNAAGGTGYVSGFSGSGRQTLSGVTATQTAGGVKLDFDDAVFAALQSDLDDVKGAIIYEHLTDDASSKILFWIDFDSDYSPNGNDLTVSPNGANGIATLTVPG